MNHKILITGASAGFGRLATEKLLANGKQVVASMRGVSGKNQQAAKELEGAGATVVEIDVTDDQSVNSGVAEAIEKLGGLDIVVNNAGIGVIGMQEKFTVDDMQKVFDVNVFGVHRVNRAVLPHMRTNGSGLLIHVSSLLGRVTFPFYGPYNASKWALEALVENYRVELSGFGIECCLVEPGGYATSFFDGLLKPSDHSRDEDYQDLSNVMDQSLQGFADAMAQNPEQKPQNVADAIAKLVDTPAGERPFRTLVDKMGMGDQIQSYNDHADKLTNGIYSAFGMADMLKPKVLS